MTAQTPLSGVITTDPLIDMPVGASLEFETVTFGGSDATGVPRSVSNWTFFEGALLAIYLRTSETDKVIGTAVIIAPGLAISATHIIQADLPAILEGTAAILCVGTTATGMQSWRVRKVNLSPAQDDTCYLSIELASALPADARLWKFALTARPPAIGEQLHVIGYQLPEVTRLMPDAGVRAGGHLYVATGTVINLFPSGRDRLLLPYPSIEIACGTLCGMSGGAVLDSAGRLMGVISRGWDLPDGGGPSYAAWVVGSLLREVEITWPPGFYRQPSCLWDIDSRILIIEDRDRIQVDRQSGNGRYLTDDLPVARLP